MTEEELITIPKSIYESERKMRFFGGETEDIYKRKYNIFIGISISNKKITPEMALNYLKWAVRHTKEKVAVIIADELNIVNYQVLDKYSLTKSKKRAKKVGDQFEKLFEDAMNKLSIYDKERILIYRWEKVREDTHHQKIKNFLEESYKKDPEFKSGVLYFIRKYMRKKGKVIEDPKKMDSLASYIIGELPTLLEGINIEGKQYRCCIYPTYFSSGMSQFVMDIHSQELKVGKDIKNLLKNKAVLIEAWLD